MRGGASVTRPRRRRGGAQALRIAARSCVGTRHARRGCAEL